MLVKETRKRALCDFVSGNVSIFFFVDQNLFRQTFQEMDFADCTVHVLFMKTCHIGGWRWYIFISIHMFIWMENVFNQFSFDFFYLSFLFLFILLFFCKLNKMNNRYLVCCMPPHWNGFLLQISIIEYVTWSIIYLSVKWKRKKTKTYLISIFILLNNGKTTTTKK